MAAATAMASATVVAAPVRANKLSSSAAFGASQTQFAPIRNVNESRVVAVTASYSEENTPVSKQVLSSVVAAGLAITIAGSAFAASGPGGSGGERTARKADQLLQGADSLIKNDSPQRFGPERGLGNGTDKNDESRFSQKAGSGAIPNLQDATSAQVSGARDKFASNLNQSKRRIDGIWGMGKGMANDAVATVQGQADEAVKSGRKLFGQAPKINMGSSNIGSSVKDKADEVTAPAKSAGGGFFGKIKQQTKGVQGAVAKKGAELQSKLPK